MQESNAHKSGYKHRPIGWIPEEWEVNELGKVVDIFVGRDLKEDCYSEIQAPRCSGFSEGHPELTIKLRLRRHSTN
jgi:hypothetical protein